MSPPTTPSEPASTPAIRRARFGLGVGLPIVILLTAFVPLLAFRAELPNRVASHFDLSGTPDGSMSVTTFTLVNGAMIAVGIALCIGAAMRTPADVGVASTVGFLGAFIGGLAAAILASTAIAQRGLDDWREAGDAGWMLLATLGVAGLFGAVAALLGARLPIAETSTSPAQVVPETDVAVGDATVWIMSLRSLPMSLLGATGLVVGIVVLVAANWFVGAIVIASSLLIIMLSTLRVRVDRTGLRVKYGWLPIFTTHVAVERISSATAIDVRPMAWGGWGYRGSLKLMRRAAVVLRAGPGIRLDLVDGRVFVVTVDHPEQGVAILDAHVDRAVRTSPRESNPDVNRRR